MESETFARFNLLMFSVIKKNKRNKILSFSAFLLPFLTLYMVCRFSFLLLYPSLNKHPREYINPKAKSTTTTCSKN